MRVSVGDCRLFVDVEGPGLVPDGPTMRERPTLIVLHGGPGLDHTSFKPGFGVLAEVAQVVYLDHRGQGRSDRSTPDRWNLARWADDVVALCDTLGIVAPIVYGVSFGGIVALQYAVRHPGHAGKLILDSTRAVLDADAVVETFRRLGGDDAARAAREYWDESTDETFARYLATCAPLYNRHHHRDAEVTARQLPLANFELVRHWSAGEQRTVDLRGSLDRIDCPVLLLAGEDDPVTPLAGARLIADGIGPQRCTFETFADCGHGVTKDQPHQAFAAMRSFIER